MRQIKRKIERIEDIADILARCDTVRIGFHDDEYPYVVPLSFGYEIDDGKIIIYIHGAKEGLKHDLIVSNNKVCVEADIFQGYKSTGFGMTTTYESVIGFGKIEAADLDDSIKGLDLLMEHCGVTGFSSSQCMSLGITTVYKIIIDKVTGKKRTTDN